MTVMVFGVVGSAVMVKYYKVLVNNEIFWSSSSWIRGLGSRFAGHFAFLAGNETLVTVVSWVTNRERITFYLVVRGPAAEF